MWTSLHSAAFDPLGLDVDLTLESAGSHKSRSGEEDHLYNPLTIHLLFRMQPGRVIMISLNNIRPRWTEKIRCTICAP